MAARTGARKRPDAERCTGKTRSGRRCKRKRADGSEFCPQHREGGAPGGRPTKLTKENADRIVQILELGGFVEGAAAAAGISKATLYAWLEAGDPERDGGPDPDCAELRARVEKARAEAEMNAAAQVAKAGASDWRAAAWYLERTNPERWAGPRGRSAAALTRDQHGPSTQAPPQGPPQLRVVDDQVAADGSPL